MTNFMLNINLFAGTGGLLIRVRGRPPTPAFPLPRGQPGRRRPSLTFCYFFEGSMRFRSVRAPPFFLLSSSYAPLMVCYRFPQEVKLTK